MEDADEDDELDVAYRPQRTKKDQRMHRRHVSNTSASSLPDYRSRHAPSTSLSSLSNVAEDSPPDYTADNAVDQFISPGFDLTSADEADTEYEPPNTYLRASLRRGQRRSSDVHRRSQSGRLLPFSSFSMSSSPSRQDRTDSILERSVQALEVSNALLQSSMSTRASLFTAFVDEESSIQPQPNTFRIDSISRRFAASDVVNARMDDLLASTNRVIDGNEMSRSAPSSSTMHVLRHLDRDTNSGRSENSLPPNSRHTSRSSPLRTGFSELRSSAAFMDVDQLPHSPNTPAYKLLASIGTRSSPSSRRRFRGTRIGTASLSDLRVAATRASSDQTSQGMVSSSHGPIRRIKSFDSVRSERKLRSREERYPRAALASVISPRFYQSYAKKLSSLPDPRNNSQSELEDTPESIAMLRRILHHDRNHSKFREGHKQRTQAVSRIDTVDTSPEPLTNTGIVQPSPKSSPSPSPLRQELAIFTSNSRPPGDSNPKPRRPLATPAITTRTILGLGHPSSIFPSRSRIRYSREEL